MVIPYYAWTLAIMTHLQPPAETPWADTYPETAYAIVDAAVDEPMFPGPDGIERTIAFDLSVAWFESRFRPDALGDGGASVGLFQIAKTFAPAETLLAPPSAAHLAQRLFLQSFRICRSAGRARAEGLAWYADGGVGCGREGARGERARRLSTHRFELAERILREFPVIDEPLD